MTTDRVGAAALLLLAVGVAWESRRLPLGTHHGPGPGYFPFLLAAALALLALVIIARRGEAPPVGSLSWVEIPRALAIFGAAGFAALALERLGYRLTVVALLAFLLGLVERRRPWLVVVLAVGVALGSFWVFDTLLRVPLPRGPAGL
jgi:putative tricarboxylic transport membrane protein